MGLRPRREHPSYVEFDHFAIASDESMSGTRETELYWLVDDLEAAYEDVRDKAQIGREPVEMPFGRLFSVLDPAGQPRYVLELAKQRPSTAVA